MVISDDDFFFLFLDLNQFFDFLFFFFSFKHLLLRVPFGFEKLEFLFRWILNWIMIDNNGLYDWIISFSFGESQLKFIAFHALIDSWSLEINSVSLNFDLNVFLMSSIFPSWFGNHIKVLQNNLAANFNVKNSLSLLLEVHLCEFNNYCVNTFLDG